MSDGQTVLRVPPHYVQLAAALGLNSQIESNPLSNCIATPTDFENLIELHRKHASPLHHQQQQNHSHHPHHIIEPIVIDPSTELSKQCNDISTNQHLPAPPQPPPPASTPALSTTLCTAATPAVPPSVPVWEHYANNSSTSPPASDQRQKSPVIEYHPHQTTILSPLRTTIATVTPSLTNSMEICNENKLHRQNIIDIMDVDVDGDPDEQHPTQQHNRHSPSAPPQHQAPPLTPPQLIIPATNTIPVCPGRDNKEDGTSDTDRCTKISKIYDSSNYQSATSGKKNSSTYSFEQNFKENRIYEQNQNNQNLLNQNCDSNNVHHLQQYNNQHILHQHQFYNHNHGPHQPGDENMWRPW